MFAQTDLDERLIWSVNEYNSSFGKFFDKWKISMAFSKAFW